MLRRMTSPLRRVGHIVAAAFPNSPFADLAVWDVSTGAPVDGRALSGAQFFSRDGKKTEHHQQEQNQRDPDQDTGAGCGSPSQPRHSKQAGHRGDNDENKDPFDHGIDLTRYAPSRCQPRYCADCSRDTRPRSVVKLPLVSRTVLWPPSSIQLQ